MQQAQELLASEVAFLLKQDRTDVAINLLHKVRAANGTLQASPACFRMLLQKLARFPPEQRVIANLMRDIRLQSSPVDALTQGCYVRYLCRTPRADPGKAYAAYTSMLEQGLTPDLRTTECLAECCVRLDMGVMVKGLLFALDDHNLEPSAVLCASFIAACAKTGDVVGGMVAFDQMKPYLHSHPDAIQLAYSSAIHMCAVNHQLDRAMQLFLESRSLASEKCLPMAQLDASLLPPLLAAAVQTGQDDLALSLAARARDAKAAASGTTKGAELSAHLAGLCSLLMKRQASKALMLRIADLLSDSNPVASPATCEEAGVAWARCAATSGTGRILSEKCGARGSRSRAACEEPQIAKKEPWGSWRISQFMHSARQLFSRLALSRS